MKRINLSEIPKQDPFVVPEGYLESLPQSIQERVTKPRQQLDSPFAFLLSPKLQAAFVLLVLFLSMAVVMLQTPEVPQGNVSDSTVDVSAILDEASQQDIITYLTSSTNLSVQELALEGNWSSVEITESLGGDEALETEIMQDLDVYTAEELWK